MKLDIPENLLQELIDKYNIISNTFIDRDIIEIHNEFETEIGDVHSEGFQPQIKIKRWGNECNASFRLIDDDLSTPQIVVSGDKIKFIKNKKEVHFYKVTKEELGNENGGYEMEIILKEKPATNKIEMSIETKGLDFWYQGELTQEEKDRGATRPENVIGSYAVYHKSKRDDYSKRGGKNYKAGKAFHIYRPKIVDSNGWEVWGELNIENKIQTVTIPQDFIDNAVYPIRHATGETFGYESIGASDQSIASSTNTFRVGNSFTGAAGTIDTLHAGGLNLQSGSDTIDITVLVNIENTVTDSHALTAKVERLNVSLDTTAVDWFVFTAASEEISAISYILNILGDPADISTNARIRFDASGGSGGTGKIYSEIVAGGYVTLRDEDPWTETDFSNTRAHSLYVTYTPAPIVGPVNIKTKNAVPRANIKTKIKKVFADIKTWNKIE